MNQPLYQLIRFTAEKSGLSALVQENRQMLLTALAVFAALACLCGFYIYRWAVSGLVMLAAVLAGFCWIMPAFGKRSCVTFCAVIGVTLAVMFYLWYRTDSVLVCAAAAASLAWQGMQALHAHLVLTVLIAAAAAIAAGIAARVFPLWGVNFFTALWGGITFVSVGGVLWTDFAPAANLWAGLAFAVLGFGVQLLVFRRQKLFAHIMPQKWEDAIERRKTKRRVAA